MSDDHLGVFLESQETQDIFSKNLEQLFPPPEQNAHQILQQDKFKHFSNKKPINNNFLEFVIEASKNLKISCQHIYYYIDFIVSEKPSQMNNFLDANYLKKYVKNIYDRLIEFNETVRMSLIQGIYDIFQSTNYITGRKRALLEAFLSEKNNTNNLLNILFESLKSLFNQQASHYQFNNLSSHLFFQLQEEILLQQIIIQVYQQGYVVDPWSQISKRFLELFYEQNYQGSVPYFFKKQKQNFTLEPHLLKLSKTSKYNQLVISSCIILGNIDLDNIQNCQNFINRISTLNEVVSELFNEDASFKNQDLSFLVTLLKLVNQTMYSKYQSKEAVSDLSNFLSDKFREIGGENFYIQIQNLIENSKKIYCQSKNVYRQLCKKLLEFLWCLKIKDPHLFEDILKEEVQTQVLFQLLEEVMKDDQLYIQFFGQNFHRQCVIGDFVFFYFESFPWSDLHNQEFSRMIQILLVNKKYKYTTEILNLCQNLPKQCHELSFEPEYHVGHQDQEYFEPVDQKILTNNLQIEGEIIEENTKFFAKPGYEKVFVFNKPFDFTTFLVDNLFAFTQEDIDEYPVYFTEYIKLLCKFIQSQPSQVTKFCQDPHESQLKIFYILMYYLQVFSGNLEYLEIIDSIVRSLKALTMSNEQKRILAFMKTFFFVKESPSLGNPFSGLLRAWQEQRQEQNFYKNMYFKVISNILVILRFMFDDDLLWLGKGFQAKGSSSDWSSYQKVVSFLENHLIVHDWSDIICSLDILSDSIKEQESVEVSNKLWTEFVCVFCQQFINQSENFYPNDRPQVKYKLFKQLFELLKCFYSKFRLFKGKNRVLIDGSLPGEIEVNQYISQLREFSSKINVMNIIYEAFEVKICNQQPLNSHGGVTLPLENKHLVANLTLKMEEKNREAIMDCMQSCVELLEILVQVSIGEMQNKNFNEQIFKDIFANFCLKESFKKYYFMDQKSKKEINVLLAVCALLKYNFAQNRQKQMEEVKFYEIYPKTELFIDDLMAKNFMLSLNPNSFSEKNFQILNYKKQQSLKDSIFSFFATLLRFWSSQSLTVPPNFKNFIYGHYSELENNIQTKRFFLECIWDQMLEKEEGVIDFLLECQKSQVGVVIDLIEYLDQEDNQIAFLQLLKKTLEEFNSQMIYILDTDKESFFLKVFIFSLDLIQNRRLTLKKQTQIQNQLLQSLQTLLFNIIKHKKQDIRIIGNYTYQSLDQDNFEQLLETTNLEYYRIQEIEQKQELVMQIIGKFTDIFVHQFWLKLSGKVNFIFTQENALFFKQICDFYQDINEYIQEKSYINSSILKNMLLSNTIPQLLKTQDEIENGQQIQQFSLQNNRTKIQLIPFDEDSKNIVDPKSLYLILKLFGFRDDYTKSLYNFFRIYNSFDAFLESYDNCFENLARILEISTSFGVEGQIMGTDLYLFPGTTQRYLFSLIGENEKFTLLSDSNPKDIFLINQIRAMLNLPKKSDDFFSYNMGIQSQFQISSYEQMFLHPQSNDEDLKALSLSTFYGGEQIQKLSVQQIDKIHDSLLSRLKQSIELFATSFEDIDQQYYNLRQIENLSRIINIHLRGLIHISQNYFTLTQNDYSLKYHFFIEQLFKILSYLIPFFKLSQIHLKKEVQYIFEAIFLSSSYLVKIGFAHKDQHTREIFNYVHLIYTDLLKLSKKETFINRKIECLSKILNNLFCLNPFLLSSNLIDEYGGLLQARSITSEHFCLILDNLYTFASSDGTTDEFLNSKILNQLINLHSIINDNEYLSLNMYTENGVKAIHAKFVKTLALVNTLVLKLGDHCSLFEKIVSFSECYSKRIEMLVSLHEEPFVVVNNQNDLEINSEIKTFALLVELNQVLKLHSYLANEGVQWKIRSPQNSEKFYFFLFKRIIKLFGQDLPKKYGKNLSDKISPKSKFESFLADIILSDDKKPINTSLNSEYILRDTSSSTRKNFQQFNAYHQNFLRNQLGENTLFSQLLDTHLCSIIFYTGMCLQNHLEQFNLEPFFKNNTLNSYDNHNKLLSISQNLIDVMLYLMFIIKKITHHQQIQNEGNLKLNFYFATDFAYMQTGGTNLNYDQMSVIENKQVVRKSFEIFIYIHHFFGDLCLVQHTEFAQNLKLDIQNHFKWMQSLLRDYEQWLPNRKSLISSQMTPNTPFKSASKQQSLSRFEENLNFDIPEKLYLLDKKQLHSHMKNFEVLKKLYD